MPLEILQLVNLAKNEGWVRSARLRQARPPVGGGDREPVMDRTERTLRVPAEDRARLEFGDRAVLALRAELLRDGGVGRPDRDRAVGVLRDLQTVPGPLAVLGEVADVVEDRLGRSVDRRLGFEGLHGWPPRSMRPSLSQRSSAGVRRAAGSAAALEHGQPGHPHAYDRRRRSRQPLRPRPDRPRGARRHRRTEPSSSPDPGRLHLPQPTPRPGSSSPVASTGRAATTSRLDGRRARRHVPERPTELLVREPEEAWLSGYRPRAVRHRLTESRAGRFRSVAYSPCGSGSSSSETEFMQ